MTTPSGGAPRSASTWTLSSTPDNVQAFALGNFDNRGRSIALLGDGELSVVNLNDWSAETYGMTTSNSSRKGSKPTRSLTSWRSAVTALRTCIEEVQTA